MTPWWVKAFWWIVGIWALLWFFSSFGEAIHGKPLPYEYYNQDYDPNRDRPDWCGSVPC